MRKLLAVAAVAALIALAALQFRYTPAYSQAIQTGNVFVGTGGAGKSALISYGDLWRRGQPGNWLYNMEPQPAAGNPADTISVGEIPSLGANSVTWYVWADDSVGAGSAFACSTVTVRASYDGSTWFLPATGSTVDSLSTRYIGRNAGGQWRFVRFQVSGVSAGITALLGWNYMRLDITPYCVTPAAAGKQAINFINTLYCRRFITPSQL